MTEESLHKVYQSIRSLGRKAGLCEDLGHRQKLIKESMDSPELREIAQPHRWVDAKAVCEKLMAAQELRE